MYLNLIWRLSSLVVWDSITVVRNKKTVQKWLDMQKENHVKMNQAN